MANNWQFTVELPQRFEGKSDSESIRDWFRRVEDAVRTVVNADNNLQAFHDRLKVVVPNRLGGTAYRVYSSLPQATKDNYALLKHEMIEVFHNDDFIRNFRENLSARPRKENENIRVYLSEIQLLVNTAFPAYDEEQKRGEVYRRFLAGLDPILRGKTREWDCMNVQDCIQLITNLERAQKEYNKAGIDLPLGYSPGNTITPPKLPPAAIAKVEIQPDEVPLRPNSSDIVLEKVLEQLKQLNTTINANPPGQIVPHQSRSRDRRGDYEFNNRYPSRSPSSGRGNPYDRGRSQYRSQSRSPGRNYDGRSGDNRPNFRNNPSHFPRGRPIERSDRYSNQGSYDRNDSRNRGRGRYGDRSVSPRHNSRSQSPYPRNTGDARLDRGASDGYYYDRDGRYTQIQRNDPHSGPRAILRNSSQSPGRYNRPRNTVAFNSPSHQTHDLNG